MADVLIRDGTSADLPALVDMVARLHSAASIPIPIHRRYVEAFILNCMTSPDGLVTVLDRNGRLVGFLVARVTTSSISPAKIAAEQGWWVDPEARGIAGARLMQRYESWARERGCVALKMSTIQHDEPPAAMLVRSGFAIQETAWAKVL